MKTCPNCQHPNPDEALYCEACAKSLAEPVSAGPFILLALGFVAMVLGILFSSQITLGPSLMGAACFLGIVARVVQAK